jgi:hypothetical protein
VNVRAFCAVESTVKTPPATVNNLIVAAGICVDDTICAAAMLLTAPKVTATVRVLRSAA